MDEPTPRAPGFGLLAEFDRPKRLLQAIRRARAAGFTRLDACTPFPVEGMAEALGFRDRRVPLLTLAGGVLGAVAGFGLQVYTNLDFPLDVGGRPLIAPPAFALITFELMVLGAVLFCVVGMLACNRLPRLNHPLFGVDGFQLASGDRFFLVIFADDPRYDPQSTRDFLDALGPLRVRPIAHAEEPE